MKTSSMFVTLSHLLVCEGDIGGPSRPASVTRSGYTRRSALECHEDLDYMLRLILKSFSYSS